MVQPEFLMESNSVNRGPSKENFCHKLAQRFGKRRCLKELLTTNDGRRPMDDARQTQDHPKALLEHVVLKLVENIFFYFIFI